MDNKEKLLNILKRIDNHRDSEEADMMYGLLFYYAKQITFNKLKEPYYGESFVWTVSQDD